MPAIRCWSMIRALTGAEPPAASTARNCAGVITCASGPSRSIGGLSLIAAESPRVDQHEAPAVGERHREAGPAVVARLAAALPVVPAVDLGPVRVGDHDLARHAEVNAERDVIGRGAGRAPDALSPSQRADELAAEQRMADLPRRVRAGYVGVGVVDVDDRPPQRLALDDRPGRLHLRKFRHVTSPYPRFAAPERTTAPPRAGARGGASWPARRSPHGERRNMAPAGRYSMKAVS